MSFKSSERAQAIALSLGLGLVVFVAPAFACDKPASTDRISKIVAKGDIQRPTRVSEGFAVEVTEKFWAGADDKLKTEIATDVACSIGTDTVSFARDRKFLGIYRNGKYQALN
jgi:hypothetical protein